MDRHLHLATPRQETFEFFRKGPQLPRAVLLRCQALLTQLLVEHFRRESDNRGEEESA
jgi:hypothetical protein